MGIVITIEWFAELAMALERPGPAAVMNAWAEGQRLKIGDHRPAPEQKIIDHMMAAIHAKLDAVAAADTLSERKNISEEEMGAFALRAARP